MALESKISTSSTSAQDKGHRLGNFHNYYAFNPPQNRLDVLKQSGMLEYLQADFHSSSSPKKEYGEEGVDDAKAIDNDNEKRPRKRCKMTDSNSNVWSYCDLGCNEGELSLALADAIVTRPENTNSSIPNKELDNTGNSSSSSGGGGGTPSMLCLGLDIDPVLIVRAQRKTVPASITSASFQACNLGHPEEHSNFVKSFFQETKEKEKQKEKEDDSQPSILPTPTRWNLTSVFSTTMWIHIHHGDDGLMDFLQRVCRQTELLLVEPQPSKCYRNVNVRLKKMNRPTMDVSSERLKLRANIEEEIDTIITKCGFEKVNFEEKEKSDELAFLDKSTRSEMTTPWKRSLRLYKKCQNTASLSVTVECRKGSENIHEED